MEEKLTRWRMNKREKIVLIVKILFVVFSVWIIMLYVEATKFKYMVLYPFSDFITGDITLYNAGATMILAAFLITLFVFIDDIIKRSVGGKNEREL